MAGSTRAVVNSCLSGVLTIVIGVCLWEVSVQLRDLPVYLLPAPSVVVRTLVSHWNLYVQEALLTLREALLGLCLGFIAGSSMAAVLQIWPTLEKGVMTLAILVKSTPLVVIAPLLTIWLGFGILPKILITALLTFFPVLVNALSGLQATDPALLDTLATWNASRWEVFCFARLPSSLPFLFAALKVSAPLSLIGAVVAEWTGGSGGLGHAVWLAYSNLNLPFLFAAVFILAAQGAGLFGIIVWLEKRLLFWRPS